MRDGALVLRPLRAGDVPALVAAATEAGDAQTFAPQPAEIARYVEDALAERNGGLGLPFTIELGGAVVGSTRYADIRIDDRGLEIGWTWYVPRVRRTWVNAAAKRLLLAHAFDALGMVRVQLKCDARNAASRAAIAALGATEEGTLRKHRILPDGFIRDTVMFSIVESEWPEVRARLDARIGDKRDDAR